VKICCLFSSSAAKQFSNIMSGVNHSFTVVRKSLSGKLNKCLAHAEVIQSDGSTSPTHMVVNIDKSQSIFLKRFA